MSSDRMTDDEYLRGVSKQLDDLYNVRREDLINAIKKLLEIAFRRGEIIQSYKPLIEQLIPALAENNTLFTTFVETATTLVEKSRSINDEAREVFMQRVMEAVAPRKEYYYVYDGILGKEYRKIEDPNEIKEIVTNGKYIEKSTTLDISKEKVREKRKIDWDNAKPEYFELMKNNRWLYRPEQGNTKILGNEELEIAKQKGLIVETQGIHQEGMNVIKQGDDVVK